MTIRIVSRVPQPNRCRSRLFPSSRGKTWSLHSLGVTRERDILLDRIHPESVTT